VGIPAIGLEVYAFQLQGFPEPGIVLAVSLIAGCFFYTIDWAINNKNALTPFPNIRDFGRSTLTIAFAHRTRLYFYLCFFPDIMSYWKSLIVEKSIGHSISFSCTYISIFTGRECSSSRSSTNTQRILVTGIT
jgi:hypothetical protein